MRTPFIAFAAVAAAFAVPAAAQETVTITVPTHDLDLTDSTDQSRLDSRVEQAIRRACRSGGRDLASRQVETACRAELADIASPRVELAIASANETRFASLDLTPGA